MRRTSHGVRVLLWVVLACSWHAVASGQKTTAPPLVRSTPTPTPSRSLVRPTLTPTKATAVQPTATAPAGPTPSAEVCDGVDNDRDGAIDEGVTPPTDFHCNNVGVCAASHPVCRGTLGWKCNYPAEAVDANGNLAGTAETMCDGHDNNCNGQTDESFPNLGTACCGTGRFVCAPDGHSAVCSVTCS